MQKEIANLKGSLTKDLKDLKESVSRIEIALTSLESSFCSKLIHVLHFMKNLRVQNGFVFFEQTFLFVFLDVESHFI